MSEPLIEKANSTFRLFLIDRIAGLQSELAPGRHTLPAADAFRLALEFSPGCGLRARLNEQMLVDVPPVTLAVLTDTEGLCRLELVDAQERPLARWQLQVPVRTLPDETFLPALSMFAREARARAISPSSSLEELLELPYFAPDTVSTSLEDPEALAFETLLEATLPSLHQVCARPRRNLMVEQRVVPVDRARRIPPAAYGHLASRPELWQSRTAVSLTPSRVLTELPEETLDLYENRMVVTLVRRLRRYLARRLNDVEHAYFQIDAVHATLFDGYRYNRFRNQRFKCLWNAGERFHEQRDSVLRLKTQTETLAAEVSNCLDSVLYRALARAPELGSPLKPTNILTMDPDYRRLMKLWEALETLLHRPSNQVKTQVSSSDPVREYGCYVHASFLLALRWTGFHEPDQKPVTLPGRMSSLHILQWEDWWAALEPADQTTGHIVLHLLREEAALDRKPEPVPPKKETGSRMDQRSTRRESRPESDRRTLQPVVAKPGVQAIPERTRPAPTPLYLQLSILPFPRALFGTRGEIHHDLEVLYAKNLPSEGGRTVGTNKSKRRGDSDEQPAIHVRLLLHATDPRTIPREDGGAGIGEDVPPSLVRRMLTGGENFFTSQEYQQFVHVSRPSQSGDRNAVKTPSQVDTDNTRRVGRIGLFPVSPLDLNSLERLQRVIRFYTLGSDLMEKRAPSRCPVCDEPHSAAGFGGVEGTCGQCEAKWSVRICHRCGETIPKLEPMRMRPLSIQESSTFYAIRAIAREQVLGRDQLAAMCESEEVAASGRVNVLCPHCGACPGDRQAKERCLRCTAGGWASSLKADV